MTEYVTIDEYPNNWSIVDVSKLSNGDKVACDVSNLEVNVWSVGSELVGIQWTNFRKQLDDPRSLLGYLIYYREA